MRTNAFFLQGNSKVNSVFTFMQFSNRTNMGKPKTTDREAKLKNKREGEKERYRRIMGAPEKKKLMQEKERLKYRGGPNYYTQAYFLIICEDCGSK